MRIDNLLLGSLKSQIASHELKPTTEFQAILENALMPITSKESESGSEEQTASLLDELYSAIMEALSPEIELNDRPLDRDLFFISTDIIDHVKAELHLSPTEDDADERELIDELLFIFQQLNIIDFREQQRLPVQEIAELVKMTKQIQPFEYHETTKLEQLNSELQKFVEKLKHAQSETRSTPFPGLLATVFMNRKDSLQPFIQTSQASQTNGADFPVSMQQPMTKIEQFVLHLGNRSNEQPLMNEFVKQFSNILAQSQFSQTRTSSRLFIKLYPEHLGTLNVELIQKDGAMIARMIASTSSAKELLDKQIHQLKQAFAHQNIPLDKVEITYNNQHDLQKYPNGQGQQEGKDGQANHQNEKDHEEGQANFSDTLNDLLFEMEV
ncbi:flagellar hook-length control protein FliK [Bacillus sp. FJAT-50079]|uniref:flagellar hook-length control protein FliK n=1 Tax=Bacillus sp. FJAT-50079 TaxID=2833577 RepID=UPI001BCA6621|nr:flagellar hook-length control protein FliK [Bacillus sp. FJAT-50079]MBS4207621.1 flagellar hook-length control protein FliK [Bacillus sp. FJAT-50079]